MKWYEDKEYWLMCEGAEEIQNFFLNKFTGFFDLTCIFYCKKHDKLAVWNSELEDVVCFSSWDDYHCFDEGDKREMKNFIWLPSQEDLQEMVAEPDLTDYGKLYRFDRWLVVWNMKEELRRRSANQFWLMFVMHELYQKKWNPETKKWEKKETQ